MQDLTDLWLSKAYFSRSFAAAVPVSQADVPGAPVASLEASVGGVTRVSLKAADRARIAFKELVPAGAFVRVYGAAQGGSAGAMEFSLEARVADGRTCASRKRLRPGRGWVPLHLDLSVFAGLEAEIVFSTNGENGDAMTGFWGSPALFSPRPRKDLWRALWKRLRAQGPGPILRWLLSNSQAKHDPASAYQLWLGRNALSGESRRRIKTEMKGFSARPIISLITPAYNVEARWLDRCVGSVLAQLYPYWELCLVDDGSTRQETLEALRRWSTADPRIRVKFRTGNGGISAASNDALEMARGEFVGLLDDDDELSEDALFEAAKLLNAEPGTDWIYSDEDQLDLDGSRCQPFFKPDWSPDYFFSLMYTCHFTLLRTALVRKLGGFRTEFDGSQDYDLGIRMASVTDRVAHIPKVLYHWRRIPGSAASDRYAKPQALTASRRSLEEHMRRRGIAGRLEDGAMAGQYRIRRSVQGAPSVSVLVLGGLEGGLGDALRGAAAKAGARCEILRAPSASNSDELNRLLGRARGDDLLLYDGLLEPESADWLGDLLACAQRPEIGAVGAKLLDPSGRLAHAGLVFGLKGVMGAIYEGMPADAAGYFYSATTVRDYSAVSAACFMTRREVFKDLGGFSRGFSRELAAADYCLRARKNSLRVLYVPQARLRYRELPPAQEPDIQESQRFLSAWKEVVENDPFYNPNLSLLHSDGRIRLLEGASSAG